jgi:eukaryotic-like serine/threonine-protein kinase
LYVPKAHVYKEHYYFHRVTNTRQQDEALFEAARNLSDLSSRGAFLDQACAHDPGLRQRVETLLAAQMDAERFFQEASPLAALSCAESLHVAGDSNGARISEGPSSRIGPYKLLQRLGEGGGGVVYMAEQEKPVRRRVALKIIKLGMDTKNVIARFEAERQALALMDHPHIARVLDAGATETGRPFFVMELVRGVKITDYCDQNNLDTRSRLALFIQICHAIQHAHQKGVVHRDIKPSNILVTLHDGVPVPKVIDFGIAKATEGRLTERTLFTAYEQIIGTPAYMSPEQAEMSGLDVDTRSDIYSLGVLLYELLTGRTPFDAKELMQAGLDQMRRTLREKEPQRPSTMLTTLQGTELTATAQHRHAEPPKLISLLKGDLDWIVMKALEKDRARRYETANGLAMDTQRYLNNEAVTARPPTRRYRFQKLVRRNKVVFAAVGAVALALILGLGASTWLFFKERKMRQRAVAAEQQQSRLRELAERGQAQENKLRLQAEAREKMTQAAVLISQGRNQEADDLIAGTSLARETLEGATVFRALGDWSALQGHWNHAADRFEMLLHVDQIETVDNATLDYTRYASALIQIADKTRYEKFRQTAIARLAGTSDPIFAERFVKVSLLLPGGSNFMAALAPAADFAAKSFSDTHSPVEDWMLPWRCVSLALWEYRAGNWLQAADWGHRCLAYVNQNAPRKATAYAILAMTSEKLKQDAGARAQLSQATDLVDSKFKSGLDLGNGAQGFWFDWVVARILSREAALLILGDPLPATADSQAK